MPMRLIPFSVATPWGYRFAVFYKAVPRTKRVRGVEPGPSSPVRMLAPPKTRRGAGVLKVVPVRASLSVGPVARLSVANLLWMATRSKIPWLIAL